MEMRILISVFIFSMALADDCPMLGETDQYDALMDFYEATSGNQWTKSYSWGSTSSVCEWYGVRCDDFGLGCVQSISLPNNSLSGTLPKSLQKLEYLNKLNLERNNLKGSIPIFLDKMSSLSTLSLSHNQFTGSISDFTFENIRELKLANNSLSGMIPQSIYQNHLNTIDLSFNNLTSPAFINNTMDHDRVLLYLNISHNQFQGEFPVGFSLYHVVDLNMSHNQIGGTLDVLEVTYPKSVDVSYNNISGRFPNITGQVVDTFKCQHNSLHGVVPTWGKYYYTLKTLDISSNHFTGILPSDTFAFDWTYFNISNNLFTGLIPNKTSAKTFACDMSSNSFLCPVPASLKDCASCIP